MDSSYGIVGTLHSLVTVLWVIVELAAAGAIVFRFRKTPTTFLAGGGFALMALVRIFLWIVRMILVRVASDVSTPLMMLDLATTILYAVLALVVAAGIACVPMSLRKLASS